MHHVAPGLAPRILMHVPEVALSPPMASDALPEIDRPPKAPVVRLASRQPFALARPGSVSTPDQAEPKRGRHGLKAPYSHEDHGL
jgi:hypothetical protein